MSTPAFILDCKGREILPGDTLKVFHFTGARRKRYFMYKYVEAIEQQPTWKDSVSALRISHLSNSGETFLKIRDGQQWAHCEIVQGYGADGTSFDSRPRQTTTEGRP